MQLAAGVVVGDSGDQYDPGFGARGQQRGQPRPARPLHQPLGVDHRHGSLRAQPGRRPFDIDVEHRIAYDHKRFHTRSELSSTSSTAMHSPWTSIRWIS